MDTTQFKAFSTVVGHKMQTVSLGYSSGAEHLPEIETLREDTCGGQTSRAVGLEVLSRVRELRRGVDSTASSVCLGETLRMS